MRETAVVVHSSDCYCDGPKKVFVCDGCLTHTLFTRWVPYMEKEGDDLVQVFNKETDLIHLERQDPKTEP